MVAIDNLLTGSGGQHRAQHPGREVLLQKWPHDATNYLYIDGPVDYVLHFASPASPIDYLRLPIATLKVGVMGTHKALGLALNKKARFLLASTSRSTAIR